jgi:hypothetical protein
MNTSTRKPFARKKPPIDLEHFGVFEIGKLTRHRQDGLDALTAEMEHLEEESRAKPLPDDATDKQREAEVARAKAAEQVLEQRYVGILCEQIELMLLKRDPTSGELAPAEDLASQLEHAYRDKDVPEHQAIGIEEIMAVLEDIMAEVDVQQAKGNG